MFCPKCGQQNVETVRFCTRCGFRLSAVSELLQKEGLPESATNPSGIEALSLHRKDLNLGALLMYVGSLLALFVGVFYGGAHTGGLDAMFALPSALLWSLLANAVLFFVLLLGLRFSKRQKDLSLGALLMFLFTVLANFAVPVLELNGADTVQAFGKVSLGVLTAALILIFLVGQPLMQWLLRGLHHIFSDDSAVVPLISATRSAAALPPSSAVPVQPVAREGVTTSPIAHQRAQPASVTEPSTHLLEKDS